MSVYKRKGRETYSYDFRRKGVRYSGDTGEASKREAERAVSRLKKQIDADARKPVKDEPLTVEQAFGRFWDEIGQYHKGRETTLTDLDRLSSRLGKSKELASITDDDVTKVVAKRRGDGVSNATVNRSTTVLLRHIMSVARDIWHVETRPILWGRHMLKEPQERVRELSGAEETALMAEIRDDMRPLVLFALWTGCRRQEILDLEWRHIDWHAKEFRVTGKGDKTRTIPITASVEKLLKGLPRAHARVFTYVIQRDDKKGERVPVEFEGLKSYFARAVKRAGIEDFRFHDLRHTAATRILRACGNIKTAQKLLGHESIATTTKYAHVSNNDLRDALEAATPTKTPTAWTGDENMLEESGG